MKKLCPFLFTLFLLCCPSTLAEYVSPNSVCVDQFYLGQPFTEVLSILKENSVEYEIYHADNKPFCIQASVNAFGLLASYPASRASIRFEDKKVSAIYCDLSVDFTVPEVYDRISSVLGKADFFEFPDEVDAVENDDNTEVYLNFMMAWEEPSCMYALDVENTIDVLHSSSFWEDTVEIDGMFQRMELSITDKETFYKTRY